MIDAVAAKHGLTFDVLVGNVRYRPVAIARHEAFYFLSLVGLSTTKIGELMNKDHSTVVMGIKKHKERDFNHRVNAATVFNRIHNQSIYAALEAKA